MDVWIETPRAPRWKQSARSHLAWMCGLKLLTWLLYQVYQVTSRVDVWIETDMESLDNILQFQNFMWMCELKLDQM